MKQSYEPIPFVDASNLTREEWLEYRKHGIGASDIPVIFEMAEYNSVLGLFLEKVSRRPKEELDRKVVQRLAANRAELIDPELILFGEKRRPVIDPGLQPHHGIRARPGNRHGQVFINPSGRSRL